MKVAILGTRGIPNNYGGFEQFTQSLSFGLVKRGHEVSVYNSSNHPFKESNWKGVQIIHCKDRENKIGTAGQFLYDLRCNKDARKRNFDVLFHFGYSSDAIWWRSWPKNTINIVNMDGLEWKRTKYNALTRRFLKASEKWAAMHAGALIADSPAIRDHIQNKYGKTATIIPYGSEIFTDKNPSRLEKFELEPENYYLVIARMEPENNIEMIIEGWLASQKEKPLIIVGSTHNKYAGRLTRKFIDPLLRFLGPVYDQDQLNNLRAYSSLYFHGHSVGGTNPSLLEAMASGCNIVAHNNIFNKAVLGIAARYFSSSEEISDAINNTLEPLITKKNIEVNLQRIRNDYDPEKIINAYEQLMIDSLRRKNGERG